MRNKIDKKKRHLTHGHKTWRFTFGELPAVGSVQFAGSVPTGKDITDWEKLSETQRKGLFDAIDEIESGKGKSNKAVLDKFHKKYSNA